MQNTSSNSIYYHSILCDSLSLDSNSFTDQNSIFFDQQSHTSPPSTMFIKRSSLSKAERRAEHNAIERARRENLNGKFQQLAESLPNLQNYRRPSKGQIVEKALDWVQQSIAKEDRYQYQIYQLQRENKHLLMQWNLQQQQQQQQQKDHQTQLTDVSALSPPSSQYDTQQQTALQQDPLTSIMATPSLNSSSYSTDTNSTRYTGFMEQEKDGDSVPKANCPVSISMSTSKMSPDSQFYNPLSTSSSPIHMDSTFWTKFNASATPTLVHPSRLPF
ncbi:hypothetical protein BCR42DRAFT_495464 [Absidia repens]|uniref:BHLH domain-containing protein n=1 Tax=Absidia repens TaxID=90262 RepID=A0A1X2I343_9FUNG|nr:hypothetical protein BCR42DRAFT_495464 [Absidia repens]